MRSNRVRLAAVAIVTSTALSISSVAQAQDRCPTNDDEGLFGGALAVCETLTGGQCIATATRVAGGILKSFWDRISGGVKTKVEQINRNLPPDAQIRVSVGDAPIGENDCTPPVSVNSTATSSLAPALVHYVFAMTDEEVSQVGPDHNFAVGDGIVIGVGANLPGIIDVYHIGPDGSHQRFAADTVYLDAPGSAVFPEEEEYVFDDATGDETLQLQFYPCTGASSVDVSDEEGLLRQSRVSVNQRSEEEILQAAIANLPTCEAALRNRAFVSDPNDDEGLIRRRRTTQITVATPNSPVVVTQVVLHNRPQ